MEQLPIETTVYSMSADPPAKNDRRADERHLTLFRVGAIIVGGRRDLCLVKNISAGGTLVRVYSAVDEGARVEVELKERQPVTGIVTWVRGSDVGITFDAPVDVVDLLKNSTSDPRPRMPRVEVSCTGYVREGAVVHRVKLLNISQGGLSVETSKPLSVGGEVTVSLPDLRPQGATVRWEHQGRYGIAFNTVLPLAALVEWLNARAAA